MGLYVEQKWTKTTAVIVLIAAFLIIYLPWLSGSRELFREESLYAVETVEYGENSLQVTAHGMPVYSNAPLFPAICRLVWKTTGLPLELVMRGISMLMLAAGKDTELELVAKGADAVEAAAAVEAYFQRNFDEA